MVFTVFVKALFFPLANYSYRSMSKMKLLAPKMTAIRERLKDDPQKMQSEMMGLYRAEKVNPASGCLPMVVQIPVFFSLYKVIFVTIEMRQAPFFRLDPRPVAGRPDQCVQPVRADPVQSGRLCSAAASGGLAADHGLHDVPAAEDEPAAAGPGAGQAVPIHAYHFHLHDGEVPGRSDHLLELEQHAVGGPAMVDSTTHAAGETLLART